MISTPRAYCKYWKMLSVLVCKGANIGVVANILPGTTIGEGVKFGTCDYKEAAEEIWIENFALFMKQVCQNVVNELAIHRMGKVILPYYTAYSHNRIDV